MEESNEQKRANILTLKYVRVLRMLLWILGAWPSAEFGEKIPMIQRIHRWTIPLQTIFAMSGQINYLVQKKDEIDFFRKGHVCLSVAIFSLSRTILLGFRRYDLVLKRFLIDFHLDHFKDMGNHYAKVNMITNKRSRISIYSMLVAIAAAILSYNMTPMYNSYKAGAFSTREGKKEAYEFSLFIEIPGIEAADYVIFYTIYNYYLTFTTGLYVSLIDLLLILMVLQIIGHMEVLIISLNNLTKLDTEPDDKITDNEDPKFKMFNAEENNKIHIRLTEAINHHRLIIEFVEDIEFFSPVLGITYLCHLFIGCLSLLEISQADFNAIVRYGPETLVIFGQLFLMSITLQLVENKSEKLPDQLYYVSWERMNTKNRRTVHVFLHRLQYPITITALGMTTLGVETMAKVLKATFSYYTFLKSMDKR